MPAKPNSLHPKPDYCLHRKKIGAPVAADTVDLADLFAEPGVNRASISCKGWKTVQVLTRLGGGTSPTVDIQPLEHLKGENLFGADVDDGFEVLAATISGAVDGQLNEVTINQGRLYLRIDAVGGVASPTSVRFFIAGKERGISHTGQN
jgi:hypothetical protein